ncbi:uncharacterized protein LOC132294563 isoform X2 [Cornus florida]|nr:uncharacterized protein LOC132294563 isoform X2 [Cornus florida]XP_059648455.1 uncharacterized protein LOC132294563 isoform X2 [Cornus florida]XP_059648456.1 uncharacterized protein LOC132294563 isoform X2 [Cornus florida]
MGTGGKLGNTQSISRRVQSKTKDFDDSDEDYTVGDDEECNATDEYCSSFAGDESEEILGELEEDEEEVKMREVARSKRQKSNSGTKGIGFEKPQKKKRVSYNEYDDEDYDGEDYDDDEEFMPDEIDYVDDEDELVAKKKKNRNVGRPFLREKSFVKGRKRKRNSKVMKKVKKPMRKKLKRKHGFGRKSTASIDLKLTDNNIDVKGRSKKSFGQRKRRLKANSDPDFRSSGSSDFEYTISEEEREQVREASEFCRSLTTSLKNSYSSNISQGPLSQQRPGRKGKEKVKDLKDEVGKQICGICLSEEGKKTIQGTINCCTHFFCFACIMEWSKVESRCPLCKQRFVTISKPARSNKGFDLRTVVTQVPERDQVYQPSEEELRGFLDPYESVMCTECQQGGDDALMLLCDLCDSPAHTYCVGLGREVPEGNWYCEGCRLTALGFSTPQAPNPTTDQRRSNLSVGTSPFDNVGESLDPTSMYVPDTPLTQGTGLFSSPRDRDGDLGSASSVSGAGAFTVSERRRIQSHIHHLLNNRMNRLDSRTNGISARPLGNNFSGSEIDQGREVAYQDSVTSERVATSHNFFEGRLQDNPTYLAQNRDHSCTRFSNSRATCTDGSVKGRSELGINVGINLRSDNEQLLPHHSRSSIGSDASVSMTHFIVEKEQVQSMVKSHLKSLSRDTELGYSTFKDIARSSTHTILAACGLDHRGSEVYPVQPPPICNHVEQTTVGQMSPTKGHCSSCFDSFARDVVRVIMNSRLPPCSRD